MKNLKTFEIFGWSKSEKEEKKNSQDLEQLKSDILNYNWARVVGQPLKDETSRGNVNFNGESLKRMIIQKYSLIKEELPLLYKFLPELWNSKGQYRTVRYEVDRPKHERDRFVPMIVPSGFGFVVSDDNQVKNNDDTKQRALSYILNKIQNK